MTYAVLDVHRDAIRAAVLDWNGNILTNRKIPHAPEAVMEVAGRLPKHARYVMESSSVLEGTYRLMAEEMKLDATLSNLRTTLLIAKSKKTDEVDAVVLPQAPRARLRAKRIVAPLRHSSEKVWCVPMKCRILLQCGLRLS